MRRRKGVWELVIKVWRLYWIAITYARHSPFKDAHNKKVTSFEVVEMNQSKVYVEAGSFKNTKGEVATHNQPQPSQWVYYTRTIRGWGFLTIQSLKELCVFKNFGWWFGVRWRLKERILKSLVWFFRSSGFMVIIKEWDNFQMIKKSRYTYDMLCSVGGKDIRFTYF